MINLGWATSMPKNNLQILKFINSIFLLGVYHFSNCYNFLFVTIT